MFGKRLKSFVAGLLLLALPSMSLGQASDPITFTTDDATSVSAFLFNLVGGTGVQTSSVQAAIPTITIAFDTTGNGAPWVQGGNAFGATGVLGTTDTFDLTFITDGVTRGSFDTTGVFNVTNLAGVGNRCIEATASGDFVVAASACGTGTVTGTGVTPRVAFWSGTSSLTHDANFQWRATERFLHVGVVPTSTIGITTRAGFIAGTESTDRPIVGLYSNSATGVPAFLGVRSRGTNASPTAVLANDILSLFVGGGHDGTSYAESGGFVGILAEENWTTTAHGTKIEFATIAAGGIVGTNKMRLSSVGNLLLMGKLRVGDFTVPTQQAEILGNLLLDNAGTASQIQFREPSASGSNFTAFQAQAQGTDLTYILPATSVAGALTNDGAGNLSWAAGGGNVSGTGVSPRVAFWSGASTITSDANFTWQATERFLHIGIRPNPTIGETGAVALAIATEGTDLPAASLWSYSTTAAPVFIGHRQRGTNASPAAILTNDLQVVIASAGHDGTNFTGFTALLTFLAQEDFTPTAQGTAMQFATISLGTASITEKMRLTADGSLGLGTAAVTGAANFAAVGSTHIFGSTAAATTVTVGQADASGPAGDTVLRIRRGSLSSSNDAMLAFNNNGSVNDEGRIFTNTNGMFLDHNIGFSIRATLTSPLTIANWTSTGLMTETANTSNTSSTTEVLTLAHNTTGTPAAGFGSRLRFRGESATVENRDMAAMEAIWTTATDASRTADIRWLTVNSAAALAEQMRLAADGDFSVLGNNHVFGTAGTATTVTLHGGGTIIGGTASGNNITIQSTSHATKGLINLDDAVKLWPSYPEPGILATVRLVDFNRTLTTTVEHTLFGISLRPTFSPNNRGFAATWYHFGGTFDFTAFDSTGVASAQKVLLANATFTTSSSSNRPTNQFAMVEDATIWESNNVDLFGVTGSLARHRGVDFSPIFRVVGASATASFGISNVQGFRATPDFTTATAGQSVNAGTITGYTFAPTESGPGVLNVSGNVVAYSIGAAPAVTFTGGGAFISLNSSDALYTIQHAGAARFGANSAPVSTVHVSPATAAAFQIDPFGASAGNTGEIRLLELAANGTNYVGFKSPDSISANVIWTWPNADGSANQVLTTSGAGVLSWTTPGAGTGVTYATDVVTGSTTTIPNGSDLTANTVTTTPGTGVDVQFIGSVYWDKSGASNKEVVLKLFKDGTEVNTADRYNHVNTQGTAVSMTTQTAHWVITSEAAGSHTYTLRLTENIGGANTARRIVSRLTVSY